MCVCGERERESVCARTAPPLSLSLSHTHTISCCSITGGWILFIMAWRSCFLFHSIGLPCKPAYALSATAMIGFFLFRTTRACIYILTRMTVTLFSFDCPHLHYHIYNTLFFQKYIHACLAFFTCLALLFRLLVSVLINNLMQSENMNEWIIVICTESPFL